MQKAIAIFINSAGALLLAMATALVLINWTSAPDYVSPRDPIFAVSVNDWFWIFAGLGGALALVCLFSDGMRRPLLLLAGVGFECLIIRIGLAWEGCRSLSGYLQGFSRAFSISAGMANAVADAVFAYLFIGSCVALLLERRLPADLQWQKMSCPSCGGRVKFPIQNLGQMTDCPHCQALVTLRKPEEILKMACYFCKEHVEFPAHALGRKIKCPHCKIEIGLKEETV
ncbi:MAG: hypothetical protein ACREFR_05620 [Limisphaerales bacterium]